MRGSSNVAVSSSPLKNESLNTDPLIAATALEEHLTPVTIAHDFARVSKLDFQLVKLKAA